MLASIDVKFERSKLQWNLARFVEATSGGLYVDLDLRTIGFEWKDTHDEEVVFTNFFPCF